MSKYKINSVVKKNTTEVETFAKGDKSFSIETLWRHCEYIVESEEPIEATEGTFEVTEYQIEDSNLDDGIATYFNPLSNMTEEECEGIEEFFWSSDGGYFGLENDGWEHLDTEVFIFNGVEVEKLDGQKS